VDDAYIGRYYWDTKKQIPIVIEIIHTPEFSKNRSILLFGK
jgi:hypothetical protein